MRYLHPVSHHERFVASGVYTTTGVGQDTAATTTASAMTTVATEEWSIHLQPGGSRFIRLDCTPGISGVSASDSQEHLLAEILQSPEGIVERVDLVWFRRVVTRRVSLTIFENYVQIGYKAASDERQYFEVDIPDGTRLLPPFTLFALGSVNVPDVSLQGQWIGMRLDSTDIPPPMMIRSIDWQSGETEVLTFGRKQITTQAFTHHADAAVFTVWRDQRMSIPVRVTAQSADVQSADVQSTHNPADGLPRLIKTGELRSIAY